MMRRVVALMLLLAPLAAPAADALGRFLTSPAERARLDAGIGIGTAPADGAAAPPAAREAEAREVSVDGYIRRGDGSVIVWINGEQRALSNPPAEPGAKVDGGDGSTRVVRPGQVLDRSTGRVQDRYQRGP